MLIRGKNVSKETIKSDRAVKKVILRAGFHDEILSTIKAKHIPYEFVSPELFDKKYKDAQGIVCEIDDFEYASLDECLEVVNNDSLVLILDGISDPMNLGNMIRTFETLGGSFIMIPKNRSAEVNDTVMKVSCGAYLYTKIVQVTNLNKAIDRLKEKGYWIAGADMDGTTDYDKLDVDRPLAIVIGSEGFGISRLVQENCDYLINIPMKGKINSMNASISAAIIMSDIISRRRRK
jgi:23S rRNA (guanosine2251-2'-O)-methyltransferase